MALITLPLRSRYPWDFSAWLNTVIYCCRWVINAKESEIHRDSIFLFTLSVATGVLLHYLFIRLSPFQFTTNHFRIDENSDFRIYFLANYSFIGGDIGLNYSSTNAWRVLACASPYSVTMKTSRGVWLLTICYCAAVIALVHGDGKSDAGGAVAAEDSEVKELLAPFLSTDSRYIFT